MSHVENEGPRHKETYAERRKRNNDKKPKNEIRKKEVSIAFIQKMRKQKAAGQKIEIAKKFKEEGFDSALLRKCGAKECHGKDLKIALDLFFNGKTEGSKDFIKSIKEDFRGPLYIEEPGMKAFRGADGITILPAVDSETWEDKSNVTITHLFDNTYLFVFTYYHQYDSRNDVFRNWDVIVTMNKNGTIDYDYDSVFIVQS